MSRYTVKEFQRLSSLSDSALLWLIRENRLKLAVEQGELLIDFTAKDMEALIEGLKSATHTIASELKEELVETAAGVLREELGVMLTEALSKAQARAGMRR